MDITRHLEPFAAAYADAVLAFEATDTPHGVYFDKATNAFTYYALDPRMAPDDVDVYVASLPKEIGGIGNLERLQGDPAAIRTAIISAMVGSGSAEGYVARMFGPRTDEWIE